MSIKLQTAVKAILAGSALSVLSSGAFAAGGVTIQGNPNQGSTPTPVQWVGGPADNVIGGGVSMIQTTSGSVNRESWTTNPNLNNDAWGHTGQWFNFSVTSASPQIDVMAQVLTGNTNLAFTMYASNGPFNGGTNTLGATEQSLLNSSNNPAHDFNQVGQIGSYGTVWMTDPSVTISPSVIAEGAASVGGGNMLETLAYVNSGIASTNAAQNGYDQVINSGVNQVATDNNYFSGSVGGGVGSNYAELIFNNLAIGNYTIFIGGANAALTLPSTYDITVTAVPLPGAVYLFGTAIASLLAAGRRKQQLA